mgnify:CR=1 FL=1
MKKEKEKNEKIKTKKARMRSIRCVGKDVAVLIVRQVKHQSTRASLALVSKNFYWAVRETIEYFLANGGIASFCINRIICTSDFNLDRLHPKIDGVHIAVEKIKEGYYQSAILEKHRRNNSSISVKYKCSFLTGIHSKFISLKYTKFIDNYPVLIFDMGPIRFALPITLLPEK